MKKIDAVKMVRNIRDNQNTDTAGKSPQEIIDYFRRKAKEIAEKVEVEELSERRVGDSRYTLL